MTVRDIDRGLDAFVARLASLSGVRVTVGVHADDEAKPHPSGGTVGEVASIAEMGTDMRRPTGYLRSTIDAQRVQLAEKLAEAGRAVLRGGDSAIAFGRVATELATEVAAKAPVDTGEVKRAIKGRVGAIP